MIVRDKPVFGQGPGMILSVYPRYRWPEAPNPRTPHLHDNALQIAAERGLPCLVFWLWLLAAALGDAYREARRGVYGPGWVAAASLAGLAAMSRSHFARVFRRETGRPPQEYLRELRLGKARQLLRGGDIPLTEVALRCGFGTSSHFAATFRRRFGTTPRGYRAPLARSSPATKKERIAKEPARAKA